MNEMYNQPPQGFYNGAWGRPAQPQQDPNNYPLTSSLSKEQEALLTREAGKSFFTPPTDALEVAKYVCNHVKDGHSALQANPDGTHTCSVCKTTFHYIDPMAVKTEDIHKVIEHFRDVWETIKFNYGAVTPKIAKELYSFGAVLDQMDNMWACSADYVSKVTAVNPDNYNQGNTSGDNWINYMNGIYAGNPAGMGVMTGQPGAAPSGWGQPAQPNGWGQPAPQPQGWSTPAPQSPGWGQPGPNGWQQQQPPMTQPNGWTQPTQPAPQPNQPAQPNGWGSAPAYAPPAQQAPPAIPAVDPAKAGYHPESTANPGMPNPIGNRVAEPKDDKKTGSGSVSVTVPGSGFKA